MLPGIIPTPMPTTAAAVAGYQIARSLRFRPSATGRLTRTPGVAPTSSLVMAFACWIKKSAISTQQTIFSGNGAAFCAFDLYNDQIRFIQNATAGGSVTTSAVFRDPSAWMHVIVGHDSTQAVAGNRVFIIVNGQAMTFGTNTTVQNQPHYFFASGAATGIGQFTYNATAYLDGYLADVFAIDGYPTGLNASNWSAANLMALFGAFDATTGVWNSKA